MAGLDAFGIIVADMATSLGFYRLLGLPIEPGMDEESHVEVALGGAVRLMFDTVDVVRQFTTFETPTGSRGIVLAYRCDSPTDVDRKYAAIIGAGHRSKTEPFDAFWGQRYATVLDPDGNPVDLYAPLP